MSQLAEFVVVCEALLRIEPNKDLFRQLFKVKSHKEHDFDGGVLTPMGGMNIQMRYGVSRSFSCLPLRSSNSGCHGNWNYIRDAPFFGVMPMTFVSWS